MFLGYSLNNWIGLLKYLGIMIVLGIGTTTISCILANKSLHKNKRHKNKLNNNKNKSWFIDVA